MTNDERIALRALAEAATPGPWKARYERNIHNSVNMYWIHETASLGVQHGPDARYIAAANPAAIGALLDALDAAEAERDAAIARTDAAEALPRETRNEISEHLETARLLNRIDAALAAKEQSNG